MDRSGNGKTGCPEGSVVKVQAHKVRTSVEKADIQEILSGVMRLKIYIC
jgi:hypothetical protein